MARRGRGGSDIDGSLAMIILGLIALPIVGLVMMLNSKTEDNKVLGGVLLVVGIVLWIIIGIASN
jgi:hypothetical protein